MGTVIIDRRGTVLTRQGGALCIREPDQPPRNLPLRMIDRLVVAGAVQLDSTLLTQLAAQQTAVLILPARGAGRSSQLFATGHGDLTRRLGQYRLAVDAPARCALARRIVTFRVLGQRRLLQRMLTMRPDLRRRLLPAMGALGGIRLSVATATDAPRLRGLEGAASAQFFAAYRAAFAPSLGFERRNRRPPRDPVNAALSLGYTLLHADALRALSVAGLDPLLGFLHEPVHGRESLACDLVELGRSRVEAYIWRLFATQTLRGEDFRDDNGAVRLGKNARSRFFATWEQQAPTHRRWLHRYARGLARRSALAQESQQP
ncbi:MAG: CRISPR-associated endonuclease Cas1 [Pseudomonadota bacterium]|nr:CRISPR-associated endonuclease Cas1 [Pseudomonadota bacterium]